MRKKRFLLIVLIGVAVMVNIGMASLFILHDVLNFTSSNSALYIMKSPSGGIEISRDILTEDANRLIFMLDANCIFNYMMKGFALASHKPAVELTWDSETGRGDIKQFRADGKMLEVSFSRYMEDGTPHGLFIGGDLPYGDIGRDGGANTSGMAYHDGKQWNHIWCAANEAFNFSGTEVMVAPPHWGYLGSRVIKNTNDEVVLQSDHETELNGQKVLMHRAVSFRASDDYVTLRITFKNPNPSPIVFSYVYGDEPWIGKFGSSMGDVGWYDDGLIQSETVIDPAAHKYAGYWDFGNEKAGEQHAFTGYADFIEWGTPTPAHVFLSNDFKCCEDKPLNSIDKRVISVVWRDEHLMPGESKSYELAVGLAKVVNGFPRKPEVRTAKLD